MRRFVASMLSKGNHLFQASITILDDGIKVRIPDLWRNQEEFFSFDDITGISLETPSWYTVFTYSTIRFNARGTWVEAHGFDKTDAQKIKRLIEENKRNSRGSSSSYSGRGGGMERYDNKTLRMMDNIRSAERFGEEEDRRRERKEEEKTESLINIIDKIKKTIVLYMAMKVLIHILDRTNEDEDQLDKIYDKIEKGKDDLLRFLAMFNYSQDFDDIIEECINRAKKKASTDLPKILIESGRKSKMDYYTKKLSNYRAYILDEEVETENGYDHSEELYEDDTTRNIQEKKSNKKEKAATKIDSGFMKLEWLETIEYVFKEYGDINSISHFETFVRKDEPIQLSNLFGIDNVGVFAINYTEYGIIYSIDFWKNDSLSPVITYYNNNGSFKIIMMNISDIIKNLDNPVAIKIVDNKNANFIASLTPKESKFKTEITPNVILAEKLINPIDFDKLSHEGKIEILEKELPNVMPEVSMPIKDKALRLIKKVSKKSDSLELSMRTLVKSIRIVIDIKDQGIAERFIMQQCNYK